MYLIKAIGNHLEFTQETFKQGTSTGALLHLKREVDEVIAEQDRYKRLVEYSDCLGCLMDAMARDGFGIWELAQALYDKTEINRKREWKYNGDGSYSHIKKTNGND